MGLKAIVKSLDDVDKELQGLYVEKDGVFILNVSGIDDHPTVTSLKTTMTKERDARKDLEKNFKDLKAQTDGLDLESLKDVDPEKYAKAIADLEEFNKLEKKRSTKKLKDKEEWEKLEKQLQDGHATAVDGLTQKHSTEIETFQQKLVELSKSKDDEVDGMRKSLEKTLKDGAIVSALAEAKGNIPVLTPHIAKHVKVLADDKGEYASRIIDEKGDIRINDAGQPMTISEFVTEIKQQPEFKGEGLFAVGTKPGGSGSGGNPGGSDADASNPWMKDSENLTKQGQILKSDPAKASRMAAAAGQG